MKKISIKTWVLPAIAAAAAITLGTLYIADVKNAIWEQSVSDIYEMTKQESNAFDIYLSKNTDMLRHFATNFSEIGSENTWAIQHGINELSDSAADYYVVNVEKGLLYSNHSPASVLSGDELDKYSYYKDCVINEPGPSKFTGENVISCCESFRFSDGTKGVIQSEYSIEDIVNEFSLSFYNDKGFSGIINNNGKILVHSQNLAIDENDNNIFDAIHRGGSADRLNEFRAAVASGGSGSERFKCTDDEYIYTYIPLKNTNGWYMISVMPGSMVMKNAQSIIMNPKMILMIIIISALILLLFGFIIAGSHERIKEKNNDIEYRTRLLNLMSEHTESVFLMIGQRDCSVEYISPNVEKILGIPAKTVRADIKSIGIAEYGDTTQMGREFLAEMEPESSVRFDTERVHSVSGEKRKFSETVYNELVGGSEKIIAVITEKKDSEQTGEKN